MRKLITHQIPKYSPHNGPNQHFIVRLTLFQRYGTKSDVWFSKLRKVDTMSMPDVETTLKQHCTTLIQRLSLNVRQHHFNVFSKVIQLISFFQRGLNVQSYIKTNGASVWGAKGAF